LAVWVHSTTGSPGDASANQPSAAAHASGHVAELGLPGLGTDVPSTLGVPPIERDHPDHLSVEVDHEKARALSGHLRDQAFQFITRPGAADVGSHLRGREQLDERRTVPRLGRAQQEPLGLYRDR
jgi:hypothetical protein